MSSRLPFDDTPDLATNYGLPGFEFDEEYNDGTLDAHRLPSVEGLAGLPDGVISDPTEYMEDSELRTAMGESTADYEQLFGKDTRTAADWDNWVDGHLWESGLPQPDNNEVNAENDNITNVINLEWLDDVQQDPDRLPTPYHNLTVEELAQQWGPSTNGLQRLDLADREQIEYEQALENEKPQYKHSSDVLRTALARAMRRSAYGEPLPAIKQELVDTLGHEASRLKDSVRLLSREHGLSGNVFVRASAFPGLSKGKWAAQIKRNCKTAKYLIACGNCDACRANRCSDCACNKNLGLKAVASVPWNRAYKKYAPYLASTGRLDLNQTPSNKKAALKTAFLSHSRDMSVKKESVRPVGVMPAERVSFDRAKLNLAQAEPQHREGHSLSKIEKQKALKKAHKEVMRLIKGGLLSKEDAHTLVKKSKGNPQMILRAASKIARKEYVASSRTYSGEGLGKGVQAAELSREAAWEALHEAAEEKARRNKAAKVGKHAKRVDQAVKYARRAMSEGFAGDQLDSLLEGRFSEGTLKKAGTQLVQIRKKHEGLSGHVYVDAAAYASKTGTTGCEEGSFTHRTNGLKSVMAMQRCGSCVFRNANNHCQKYNKPLVASAPVENPEAYQEEVLRLASAHDAEVTASLFTDPSTEFGGLHNANLEGFDFEDTPTHDKLAEYSFGGMDLDSMPMTSKAKGK